MLYGDKSCFSPIILPALKRICRLNQGLLHQTAFFRSIANRKAIRLFIMNDQYVVLSALNLYTIVSVVHTRWYASIYWITSE